MKYFVIIDSKIREIFKSYGIKDYSRLQKVPIVDKNGHTRMVYKKMNKDAKPEKNKNVKIKSGLKTIDSIADYLSLKLNNIGFDVDIKNSNLSGSRYITIKNNGDLFGKDKTDDIEIRISDHNLPITYDLQYKGDFDIRAGNNNRTGTNGEAIDYDTFLYNVIKKKGYISTDYEAKLDDLKKKENERNLLRKDYEDKEKKRLEDKKTLYENNLKLIQQNNPEKYKEIQEKLSKMNEVNQYGSKILNKDKRHKIKQEIEKIVLNYK